MIIDIKNLKLNAHISSGGSSIVYKGTFKFLEVAVKKITLQIMSIKELQNIFNELVILDRLKHPNIILVLGFAIDHKNNLYIISQLYP